MDNPSKKDQNHDILDWLRSSEAERVLRESRLESEKATRLLSEQMRVDEEALRKPMDF